MMPAPPPSGKRIMPSPSDETGQTWSLRSRSLSLLFGRLRLSVALLLSGRFALGHCVPFRSASPLGRCRSFQESVGFLWSLRFPSRCSFGTLTLSVTAFLWVRFALGRVAPSGNPAVPIGTVLRTSRSLSLLLDADAFCHCVPFWSASPCGRVAPSGNLVVFGVHWH